MFFPSSIIWGSDINKDGSDPQLNFIYTENSARLRLWVGQYFAPPIGEDFAAVDLK